MFGPILGYYDGQNSQNAVKHNSQRGFSGNPLFFSSFGTFSGLEPGEQPGSLGSLGLATASLLQYRDSLDTD